MPSRSTTMALSVAVAAVAALSGCNRTPSPSDAIPPSTSTLAPPATAAPVASPVVAPTSTQSPPATTTTQPAPTSTAPVSVMDCAQAQDPIEALVCEDAGLAALDRQLADVYAQALEHADDKVTLRTGQRVWIKGRNDCGKAGVRNDDQVACVRASYQARIVDLRIQNGLVTIPKAIEYDCNDNRVPFSAAFYTEEPRAAVLTLGDDQAIAIESPTASGTRYVAKGVDFREKAGKARVEFHGKQLDCTAKP